MSISKRITAFLLSALMAVGLFGALPPVTPSADNSGFTAPQITIPTSIPTSDNNMLTCYEDSAFDENDQPDPADQYIIGKGTRFEADVNPWFVPKGSKNRPVINEWGWSTIRHIVIHNTSTYGRTAGAKNLATSCRRGSSTTGWHFTVGNNSDGKGTIYQQFPVNELVWHEGRNKIHDDDYTQEQYPNVDPDVYHGTSIGIETCDNNLPADYVSDDYGGHWVQHWNTPEMYEWYANEFDRTTTNLAMFVASLAVRLNFNPYTQVCQHNTCSDKNCPMVMRYVFGTPGGANDFTYHGTYFDVFLDRMYDFYEAFGGTYLPTDTIINTYCNPNDENGNPTIVYHKGLYSSTSDITVYRAGHTSTEVKGTIPAGNVADVQTVGFNWGRVVLADGTVGWIPLEGLTYVGSTYRLGTYKTSGGSIVNVTNISGSTGYYEGGSAAMNTLTKVYKVTVTGDTTFGSTPQYKAVGESFTVSAPAAPSGSVFDIWELTSGSADIANKAAPTTTVSVIDSDIVLGTSYRPADHAINVSGGVLKVGYMNRSSLPSSGSYGQGKLVYIEANPTPAGQVFDKWVFDVGTAEVADITAAATTLVMPAQAVTVRATYKTAPVNVASQAQYRADNIQVYNVGDYGEAGFWDRTNTAHTNANNVYHTGKLNDGVMSTAYSNKDGGLGKNIEFCKPGFGAGQFYVYFKFAEAKHIEQVNVFANIRSTAGNRVYPEPFNVYVGNSESDVSDATLLGQANTEEGGTIRNYKAVGDKTGTYVIIDTKIPVGAAAITFCEVEILVPGSAAPPTPPPTPPGELANVAPNADYRGDDICANKDRNVYYGEDGFWNINDSAQTNANNIYHKGWLNDRYTPTNYTDKETGKTVEFIKSGFGIGEFSLYFRLAEEARIRQVNCYANIRENNSGKRNYPEPFNVYVGSSEGDASNATLLGQANTTDTGAVRNYKAEGDKTGTYVIIKPAIPSGASAIAFCEIEIMAETASPEPPPTPPADTHKVTVEGGSGGGDYAAGATVSISATVPEDQVFIGWSGDVEFADATAPSTSFVMPDADITVTASFKDAKKYTLAVQGGTGGGSYAAGKVVNISGTSPGAGWVFEGWTIVSGSGSFANAAVESTTFTMAAGNAVIKANYTEVEHLALNDAAQSSGHAIADGRVSGVAPNTTADAVKALFKFAVTIKKGGVELAGNEPVGTGCVVSCGSESATFVVKGDLDSTGTVTQTDYVDIKCTLKGMAVLSGVYEAAADCNCDNMLSAADVASLKASIAN